MTRNMFSENVDATLWLKYKESFLLKQGSYYAIYSSNNFLVSKGQLIFD